MRPRLLFLLLPLLLPTVTLAAGPVTTPRSSEANERLLPLPPFATDPAGRGQLLPPSSAAPAPAPLLPSDATVVRVREFRFVGSTVFTEAELQAVAAPFRDKAISLADLEEIRYRLTRGYVDLGYINSGALPALVRTDTGIATFTLVEGTVSEVRVQGTGRLRPSYVRDRLLHAAGPPMSTTALQEAFQLLLQDPLFERLNGVLRPGARPGESILDLEVTPAKPYALSFTADNHLSPSVGENRGVLASSLLDLTGFGDRLDLSAGQSAGNTSLAARVSLPVTSWDTTLYCQGDHKRSEVQEAPLDELDIQSKSESFEVGVTHPVLQRPAQNLLLGLSFSRHRVENFLWDTPFSFTAGEEMGRSISSAYRFMQEYTQRGSEEVLAVRSTFSLGTGAADATIHDDERPDSHFFSWLLQAQYARKLPKQWGQVVLRGDLQQTTDPLLPQERFAAGGSTSVRGYRENFLVLDEGVVCGLEYRYPLLGSSRDSFPGTLELAPFFDLGTAWNLNGQEAPMLRSLGVKLLWSVDRRFSLEVAFDEPLKEVAAEQETSLQGQGIHCSFTWHLF